MDSHDTIYAAATAPGRAAIAVIRLSGPHAGTIVTELAGQLPMARYASLRRLRNASGEVLDRALVLWFPGPASYSGEDMAELHLHGGHAVIEAVAGALLTAGARPAEPGEFTRRAFLHGRMDLTEAEAVADLIDAETTTQRRQALRQMEGALGERYRDWSMRLTRMLAHAEAEIDFPDDDLPPELTKVLLEQLAMLVDELDHHLADNAAGERVRRGIVCAIVGPPNVGKSSLMNRLAGRDVAIVSDRPGTTRDTVEARIVLAGVPVTLVDTAGLRDSDDAIEQEGVRRALARAAEADLVLRIHDIRDAMPAPAAGEVAVANKADLVKWAKDDGAVSALSGDGIAALRQTLSARVAALTQAEGAAPLTRTRHRAALETARRHLERAATAHYTDMRAEELRLALAALGGITGAVSVETVLDLVFRDFCIGK